MGDDLVWMNSLVHRLKKKKMSCHEIPVAEVGIQSIICILHAGSIWNGTHCLLTWAATWIFICCLLNVSQKMNEKHYMSLSRMPRSRRRSRCTTLQVDAQPSLSFTYWGNYMWRTLATAGVCESSFPSHLYFPFQFVEWSKELYHIDLLVLLNCRFARTKVFLTCVCRAIIIRNNEIIPMSKEFTPESERQRLQFLVRKFCAMLLNEGVGHTRPYSKTHTLVNVKIWNLTLVKLKIIHVTVSVFDMKDALMERFFLFLFGSFQGFKAGTLILWS